MIRLKCLVKKIRIISDYPHSMVIWYSWKPQTIGNITSNLIFTGFDIIIKKYNY